MDFNKERFVYKHMVIAEAMSTAQVAEFKKIWRYDIQPQLEKDVALVAALVSTEENGNMIIVETIWQTRELCLRWHSSRMYRQLVQATQHLLVGNFVVKLFSTDTDCTAKGAGQ